ncbi:MAG: phosphoheptose isomerase [Saprospirales bacterium]|nr:phosphoheptose isomerase [Saprospirales bacterium]HAI58048.1 phosphoheptose isomerase [Saprospirales bacterium]|tara:strand:+ start:1684 stop:2259 length:576 start_codon:yes stop_codon:yes gene_type:complete
MQSKISDILKRSIETKQAIIGNPILLDTIAEITNLTTSCFNSGGKVFFCGNGGSAADAQHLAAEFSGRFYSDRDPLFSEALHVNTSYLTAVANDYGYEHVYARLIKAKGVKGDILVGLSTSGNSKNIVKAFEQARIQGVLCIGMTGEAGGILNDYSDYIIRVPSNDTPRIQECHITIGHIICELVEKNIFS